VVGFVLIVIEPRDGGLGQVATAEARLVGSVYRRIVELSREKFADLWGHAVLEA